MISSIVKPMFVWSTNTPMRQRSDIAPGEGVISGIVPWGYMRSNRVKKHPVYSLYRAWCRNGAFCKKYDKIIDNNRKSAAGTCILSAGQVWLNDSMSFLLLNLYFSIPIPTYPCTTPYPPTPASE